MSARKILLVVARYPEEKQKIFDEYISPRNKEYALKHGYEYIEIDNSIEIKEKYYNEEKIQAGLIFSYMMIGLITVK